MEALEIYDEFDVDSALEALTYEQGLELAALAAGGGRPPSDGLAEAGLAGHFGPTPLGRLVAARLPPHDEMLRTAGRRRIDSCVGRHSPHKLTWEQIGEIERASALREEDDASIARRFGIYPKHVDAIRTMAPKGEDAAHTGDAP